MDETEDFPMQDPQDFVYPDIDDTLQYPWQGTPSNAGQPPLSSVIDPRLYTGLFSGVDSSAPDYDPHSDATEPVNALSSTTHRRPLNESLDIDELSEGSQFEDSDEAESSMSVMAIPLSPPFRVARPATNRHSSDEEMSDVAEEDVEDDDDDARHGGRRGHGRFARGGKGKRGPRKPLEPSPEFKMLHSEATSAFIDGDYDRAITLVKQAIQINPEMFAAHSLLSEILLAQGEKDKALTALFSGAHTRPKDPGVWAKVAKLILERAGEDRQTALNDVIYCYSRVIEIDPKNYTARFQRAAIYRELGYNGRAAAEYERILKERPHNTRALRHLAETYIDLDDVQKAIDHYMNSIEYYMSLEPDEAMEFSWSDVNICVELFGYVGRHREGIRALKSLSRWLLGRKDDDIWDEIQEDDREWDAEDFPRRIKTDAFEPGVYRTESYGLGLPLELRIKLGVFRLKMGDRYNNEALVSGSFLSSSSVEYLSNRAPQSHFQWLDPEDTSSSAMVLDYGDLFREAADALKEAGLFEDALRYYTPLQATDEYADVSFFMAMGECAACCGKASEAETYYLTVAEHDPTNVEVRVRLAKLYEANDMSEEALKYVNQAVMLGREETGRRRRRKDARIEQLTREFRAGGAGALRVIAPKPPSDVSAATLTISGAARNRVSQEELERNRSEQIRYLYSKMMELRPKMREGNPEVTEDWLDIADALLRDFRSNRVFYPLQRNMVFLGYSREAQRKAGKNRNKTLMDEMHEMAGRLQDRLQETLGG
jgi:general transcription factor 3C polypeptide 3 (transcription factor C subunit 4)